MAVIGVGSQATDSSVHRFWRSGGLKPHLIQTLKLSTDPCFEEKLQDVVGPYFDVQANAAAFIFDKGTNLDPPSGPVSVPTGVFGSYSSATIGVFHPEGRHARSRAFG